MWRLLLARKSYRTAGCTGFPSVALAVCCFLGGAGNTHVGSQFSE